MFGLALPKATVRTYVLTVDFVRASPGANFGLALPKATVRTYVLTVGFGRASPVPFLKRRALLLFLIRLTFFGYFYILYNPLANGQPYSAILQQRRITAPPANQCRSEHGSQEHHSCKSITRDSMYGDSDTPQSWRSQNRRPRRDRNAVL